VILKVVVRLPQEAHINQRTHPEEHCAQRNAQYHRQ
jgi:hypothetical protein